MNRLVRLALGCSVLLGACAMEVDGAGDWESGAPFMDPELAPSLAEDAGEGEGDVAVTAQGLWNGEPVTFAEFTVQITPRFIWEGGNAIAVSKESPCSGVLIDDRTIMTAGHCVADMHRLAPRPGEVRWVWWDVTYYQGGVRMTGPTGEHMWYRTFLHPDYHEVSDSRLIWASNRVYAAADSDLALLVRHEGAGGDPFVNVQKALLYHDGLYTNMGLDMFGWGHRWDNSYSLGNLLTQDSGNSLHVRSWNSRYFVGDDDRALACYGDSGGPAARRFGNRWAVVGLMSHSPGDGNCTDPGDPQSYLRVSQKIIWMQNIMIAHGRGACRQFDTRDFNGDWRTLVDCD